MKTNGTIIAINSEFGLGISSSNTLEEEDEMHISITKSRPKKKVILSDDEDEDENNINRDNGNKLNSDKESGNDDDELNENNILTSSRRRLLHLEDSDNEDALYDKTANLNGGSPANLDYEARTNMEVDQIEVPPRSKYEYKSDIFDTETSDDELGYKSPSRPRFGPSSSDGENSKEHVSLKESKKSLKKKGKTSTLSVKRNEKLEIFSESQKRMRESDICLPYHKPKQRSLSDFLNRKKTVFASSCNMRRSLKMSMKDENLLREIEERKQEVAAFYKSDSEDDDIEIDHETTQNEEDEGKEVESVDEHNSSENMEAKNCQEEEINADKMETFIEPEDVSNKSNSISETDNIFEKFGKETSQEVLSPTISKSCDGNDAASKEEIVINKQNDCFTLMDELPSNKEGVDDITDFSDCLEASKIREILSNSIGDDTENFRLYIDADDLEEADLGLHNNTNLSLELKKAISSSINTNTSNNDNNTITPKMHAIASRYPKLDLSKIAAITPKIGGNCDGSFIDLDEEPEFETPKLADGASRLIDRFVQHSNTKRKPVDAQTISLNIVSKEKSSSGEVKLVSSDILVDINPEETLEDNYKEPVPGARLVLLKSSLKAQLLQQREKERQRRENEKKFMDSEEIVQDYNDGLPDEENELTDGSETEYETESEPEEDDVVIKDVKRKKNKFLDEEAQESDEEDDNDEISDNEVEDADNQSETSRMSLHEDSNNSYRPRTTTKKVSRKIIDDGDDYSNIDVAYENDDSESEEPLRLRLSESINMDAYVSQTQPSISRASTEDLFSSQLELNFGKKESMDNSFELVESLIPGHQPGGGSKETKKNDSFLEDDTGALSMFSRLDYRRKSNSSEYADLHKQKQSLNLLLTPLKGSQFAPDNGSPVKKSFTMNLPQMDGTGSEQSQELLGLCSGQFTTQIADGTGINKVSNLCEGADYLPTQDINNLVGLCSGQFITLKSQSSSTSGEANMKKVSDLCEDDEFPPTQDITDLVGLCSGQFTTQRNPFSSHGFSINSSESLERNALSSHIEKTSSLKNGEELKNGSCSPIVSQVDNASLPQKGPESDVILSDKPQIEIYSSDEDGILQRQNKKHKRKRKRIMAMSDDEGAASEDSVDSITDDDIEYDEDELPLIKDKFSGFKDGVKGGIRSDFLDKEAELSGSEEGSEDEDEPDEDNDVMEHEAGDLDRFDEEELRNEIGKAHLKSVIDSDKRELKLLQEMYLEDGDLHGQGRQRKFRWQYLNSTEDDEGRKSDDEEVETEEVLEEEIEWRKQRFEREKFIRDQKTLKNASSPDKVVENATEPVIAPSRKLSRTLSWKPTPLVSSNSFPLQNTPLLIHNLSSSSKRGSFLRRDTSTLKKIAQFTKENQTIGGAKQGGNFVFHSLTAEEIEKKTKEVEKRKSNLERPQPKKCRLERSFFSMDAGSQNSSIFKHL